MCRRLVLKYKKKYCRYFSKQNYQFFYMGIVSGLRLAKEP